jgi:predicted O-methyltransferase YrrM
MEEPEVNEVLESLMAELERFGRTFDAATTDFPRRMLNITRDTGEFLTVLVRATKARRVLEIGTSNGYSTLWLAEAVRTQAGMVTTVECFDDKIALASANFARCGLSPYITSIQDDAGKYLQQCEAGIYDFVFLDSERREYTAWWPALRRVMCPGALLVVDNAIWPSPEEIAPFLTQVSADPRFTTCMVPVGKGQFVAVRRLEMLQV